MAVCTDFEYVNIGETFYVASEGQLFTKTGSNTATNEGGVRCYFFKDEMVELVSLQGLHDAMEASRNAIVAAIRNRQ